MSDVAPTPDRLEYESLLERAMGHASRIVPRDQAFEIAHDVALYMMRRPPEQRASGTMLFLAVTSRLRNSIRAANRRAARDGTYLQSHAPTIPTWAEPGTTLEASELRARLRRVLGDMPPAMRDAFLLVRDQGLTYKQAAARLGVSVGTVHTQLSRALSLLRACVDRYSADLPEQRRTVRRP
jgi:RNA polymerase sigma factor (sigma-70 family)